MSIRQRSSLSLEIAVRSVAEVTQKRYAHKSYKNLNDDHNINWVSFLVLHKTCYILNWVEMWCADVFQSFTHSVCVLHYTIVAVLVAIVIRMDDQVANSTEQFHFPLLVSNKKIYSLYFYSGTSNWTFKNKWIFWKKRNCFYNETLLHNKLHKCAYKMYVDMYNPSSSYTNHFTIIFR